MNNFSFSLLIVSALASCVSKKVEEPSVLLDTAVVKPLFASDSVRYDSDDPAIWINLNDLSQSLVLGTDNGGTIRNEPACVGYRYNNGAFYIEHAAETG